VKLSVQVQGPGGLGPWGTLEIAVGTALGPFGLGRPPAQIDSPTRTPEFAGKVSKKHCRAVDTSAAGEREGPRRRDARLWPRSFRRTLCLVVEVHDAARKHGVADEDIQHAVDHALVLEDVGEDPDRWLVIGPDRAGNLLEVVVLVTVEGSELAIHAMAMRAKYARLLGL